MRFLTSAGKLAVIVGLLASLGMNAPAWSGDRSDNAWLLRNKDKSTADTNINATGVSNFLGSKSGKAVTKTEVFGGRSILPMVSIASDRAMADALARYEIVVSRGGWPTVSGSRLARGKSGPDVITLRQRLAAEGYLNTENLAGDAAEEYSDTVMKAVARFQANHGLAITGKVDKPTSQAMNVSAAARLATLRANIPRMHEYSKDLGPRYIIVNVPALQLEAVNFNSVFSRHNIIAGQPSRPTPVTLTQISDINFNPYWNAPVSIVEKDILPRVRTEGTRVLRNMNMRIYDGYNGPEVDPSDVDWDNVPPDRFFFRQDPGEENAMAGVKINFPSPFGIYLHDTPTKNLFTTGARYLSSGCIRVEQVQVLVNWILNGQDGWNPGRIDQVVDSHERTDVKIENGPQLRTVYLTAWANANGDVNFRDDIYDLDGTGFIVGQPLAPGEFSDDGQRFLLKPVARDAAASDVDPADIFKSRRRSQGFGFFFSNMPRGTDPARSGRRDGQATVVANFSGQAAAPVPKKTVPLKLVKAKQKTTAKKDRKSLPATAIRKRQQTLTATAAATRKVTAKAGPVDAKGKKKTILTAESPDPKKKKKKIVQATSAAGPIPDPQPKPVSTQQ